MLVLTRKVGEEIIIGDDIRVMVVEVAPGRVKLGIVAPRDVRIDRDEIRALITAGEPQARKPLPAAGKPARRLRVGA